MNDEVQRFVVAALEASLYCDPRHHGLTHAEIHEASAQAGYKRGEIDDTIRGLRLVYSRDTTPPRLRLDDQQAPFIADFLHEFDPDYRNPDAFEFVLQELHEVGREAGTQRAMLSYNVLVTRGGARGLPAHEIEIAIAALRLVGHVTFEPNDVVRLSDRGRTYARPREQVASRHQTRIPRGDRPHLRRAYGIVKDLIARRSDGRAPSPDPLRAFEAELDGLGYPQFKVWWGQQLAEIEQLDDATTPTAVTVLCAALCEGVLVLVADRARSLNATMISKGMPADGSLGEYKKWKFDDLIVGARQPPEPILDTPAAERCLDLNRIRQRIHAGRLISEPGSITYDARPEEAARARETLKLVVRRVLDWIQCHRAAGMR